MLRAKSSLMKKTGNKTSVKKVTKQLEHPQPPQKKQLQALQKRQPQPPQSRQTEPSQQWQPQHPLHPSESKFH